jgi:pimeloyl-ACP methyl ester carboxylesterase
MDMNVHPAYIFHGTQELRGLSEMSEKIKIETVKTDVFEMDYFCFGHGEKVMVIIPGLSADGVMKYADAVAGAYESMTDDHTIYVFERRKNLPQTYSIQDMAHDTAAAIKALGLDDICLFGASQGGMISMVIAIEEPELVSRLVLGSTSACVTDEQYEKAVGEWVRYAAEGKKEELYLSFGEAVYPKEVFEQFRGALTEGAKGLNDEDLSRFIILAEAIKGFDVSDKISQITCPVLVIGSKDDNVLGGEASERIFEKLKERPDCKLHMYEGYGHAAYDVAPDYRERLLEFYR